MSEYTEVVFAANTTDMLAVGKRVRLVGFNYEDQSYPENHGVITSIKEGDEGAWPEVYVKFDDGMTDYFGTGGAGEWFHRPCCDELELA